MSENAEIDHAEHVAAIAEFNEKAALRYIAVLEARVAQLEAALQRASHHFATVGKLHSLDMRGPLHEIDAALKDAPQ